MAPSLAAYYFRQGLNRPASPAPTVVMEFVTPSGTPTTVLGSSVSFYARTLTDVYGSGSPTSAGSATSYDAAGTVIETLPVYTNDYLNIGQPSTYGGLSYSQLMAAMKLQFTKGNVAKIIVKDVATTGVVVDDLSFSGGCNNAVCVSNTIPDTLSPGQNFTATSTIGNNGTKTWTGNSYYAGIANYASRG